MRYSAIRIFAAAVLASFLSGPVHAQTYGSICIDGKYLVSGEQRTIEIFDVNANHSLGTFVMTGGEQTWGIAALINDSGYINVRYRNVTNNGSWIGSSMMHDGDCVSP